MVRWKIEDARKWSCLGRIFFIRHGATNGNAQGRYIGSASDEDLSMEGMLAVKALRHAPYLPAPSQLLKLYMSPMMRCRQTAGLLYPEVLKESIEDWREIYFGRFEGHNYEELKTDRAYQAWIDGGGEGDFPEGESRAAFRERVLRGFDRVVTEMETWTPGERGILLESIDESSKREIPNVAAVVHGGVIMTILSAYAGGGYFDYQCANGEGFACLIMLDSWHGLHLTDLIPLRSEEEKE